MTTIGMQPNHLEDHFGSEDQGVVHCTVSSRAGRLILALLLSHHDQLRSDTVTHLSKLANIPTKQLPACIDEISVVELQEQSPGLENVVDAAVIQTASISIAHKAEKKPVLLNDSHNYLLPDSSRETDPEDEVERACMEADEIEDPLARVRAQALAVVRAWEFFFPEVNKVQGLRKEKAKEWVKAAGSAATVFGWLGGVDEAKLLAPGMNWPLAYVNKVIVRKAAESQPGGFNQGSKTTEQANDGGGVPDEWRQYAQKIIEKGVNHNGNKDRTASLERIARAVGGSAG